tara:strand:- start:1018 stop:1473 length:456 start_codon:yes stop_codon:yes gene_type:complete
MKPHTAPRKPFSQDLFNANDPQTRVAAKKLLPPALKKLLKLKEEPVLVDNEKKYGIDLLCPEHNLSVEVETKHGWGDGKFQWGDLHIPRRKGKYLEIEGHVFFVVFNTNRTQAGIMTKDSVSRAKVVNKFNRLSRLKEDYLSVPSEEVIWV